MTLTSTAVALFVSLTLAASGPAAAAQPSDSVEIETFFAGEWEMRGRFRQTPQMDWIPTMSSLVGQAKLGAAVVLRDIDAPQISFTALDLLTYDKQRGVVQYIYLNNNSPTAYVFEGKCSDGCRLMELEQVCGTLSEYLGCGGRTTITVETDDRFVARDYIPSADGELFMSREVTYTRASGAP
ncbi:MAG: hypothetical protein AAGK22_10140 [Acidobacteriota bacterium]